MTSTKTPYPTNCALNSWRDVLNRLHGISLKVPSGAASVTLALLICDGEPVQWFEPIIRRLEPKRAAREFVEMVGDKE